MQSLTKQLKELKKRQKLEGHPISKHLRQVAQDRFQDVLKERKEQQEEQQKIKAADAEDKRALHLAKSREYLARQAAISTEQKWKKQRLEEAAAEKEFKSNLKQFHANIATVVAKHLMAELEKFKAEGAADELKANVQKPAVTARGKQRKNLPLFSCMEKGETVAREVEPKVFRYIGSLVQAPGMSHHNCTCSEALEWVMCKGKRMYQHKTGVTGVGPVLKELLEFTLPYYEHACGQRWSAQTLLQEADYNVDFAYLAGVWRYSHALGPTYFPGGVREWPPDL